MKKIMLLALLLCISIVGSAQIKGRVVDGDNNQPFIGVTVQVLQSQAVSTTDTNGEFAIAAKKGDVLRFSFVGYVTQEVTIEESNFIEITMNPDVISLEDLVVVGYGVQKKSDVTGSVSSVSSKDLEEKPNTNIIQSLQGAIAGLNISLTGSDAEGSSVSTLVRGGNSISASNAPLLVVDGIPFSGSWSEINSNDVESIEVLKDASSCAVYGARGANGVILIQTKRGKKEGVTVSYDGFATLSNAINIPQMMDGATFYERKLAAGGDFSLTEMEMYEQGLSTDWVDLALRDGYKQQHNLSVRGKSNKTSYYLSGNYTDNQGISIGDDFQRISGRINIQQELLPWIKLTSNTQYGFYDRSGKNADFDDAFLMNPLSMPYYEDGTLRLQTWEDNTYAKNPLSPLNEINSDISRRFTTNNSIDIEVPFIEGLNYKLNTGYSYHTRLAQNYWGRDTYEGEQVDGILSIDNDMKESFILENILSYTRDFDKHTIFLTAMHSTESETAIYSDIDAEGFPNDVMTFYQPSKAATSTSDADYIETKHQSFMLRANYSYDSRYLFTATVRRDGYSAFGESKKYGNFPSVALGWNIINEDFIGEDFKKTVNNLKFRASWGRNGNEAISAYSALPNLRSKDYLTDDYAPEFGFYPSQLASPLLGWETTESFNFGLDFALLKDRITGTIDYYNTRTYDLLLYRTIPSINGTSSILENIGETKGNGVEFQISSVNIDKGDFTWSTDFNIVHSNTKLTDVGLYDENGNPIDDIASEWFIGHSVNVNYDYVFDGIYQEGEVPENAPFNSQPGYIRYKDLNGDGEITPEDDQTIIGSRDPLFTAGMKNTFRYKNLFLSIFLNSSVGVTVPNYLQSVHSLSYRQNQLDKEFWSEENPINTYPANVADGSVNPARMLFYERADFLRIQDVNLTYRFPERICEKIKLSRLEMYLNVKNLYTFTNWSGLDPEFIGSGYRQRAVPQTREFVFGVRFDF